MNSLSTIMPKREPVFKTLLHGIDTYLDDLLKTMDVWERELHRAMEKENKDMVLEVARKGSDLGRLSKEGRMRLLEAREMSPQDLSDGAMDEANAAVEAKLDLIDKRLRHAIDDVLARQETLDDRMRSSLEAMEGFGEVGLYPDRNDEEDMQKMKEELKKDEKRKKR